MTADECKTEVAKAGKRHTVAQEARRHEIDLYWRRSLFFWGFIAVAFAGYLKTREAGGVVSVALAGFGLVCSLCWSLANRGGKYWQESWESKVEAVEDTVTGPLFSVEEEIQDKGLWLSARKYSVSKLAIALSDFVTLAWAGIVVLEAVQLYWPQRAQACSRFALQWVLPGISLYCILILLFCRKSDRVST